VKLRFRWSRRAAITLQIAACFVALPLTIAYIIWLVLTLYIPRWDYIPSDTFHKLRRFFFSIFAGRAFRPLTLRASLPSGTSITTQMPQSASWLSLSSLGPKTSGV